MIYLRYNYNTITVLTFVRCMFLLVFQAKVVQFDLRVLYNVRKKCTVAEQRCLCECCLHTVAIAHPHVGTLMNM